MTIQRIVPHVSTSSLDAQDAFYLGVLGLERLYVDPGRLHGYGIPGSGQHAVTVLTRDIVDPVIVPSLLIAVDNVDEIHAAAQRASSTIRYALTDEAWGVRRFFVEDPNGTVFNVVEGLP
jgi:lactoylglutathione lyase